MNAGYDEWFFRGIAGIRPDEMAPGYKNIVLRPYLTSMLKNAKASYESPYGTIVSDWKWEGNTFVWDIEIPANSSCTLFIPKLNPQKAIRINGKTIDSMDLSEDKKFPEFLVYNKITNGKYRVEVE